MSTAPLLEIDDAPRAHRAIDVLREAAESVFRSADRAEVKIVRRAVRFAAGHRLELPAVVATRSENGWLYPLVSLFLVTTGRVAHPARFLTCSALTLASRFRSIRR
jgi:hypothetical protein